MSVYSNGCSLSAYADRLSERLGVLKRVDETPVSWEEGYVPLVAQRGPDHARQKLEQFHDTLLGARKRSREEQIRQLLGAQLTWDLLWRTPLGRPTSIREIVECESRVVLLGEAGAGKTTALHSLAVNRPKLSPPECALTVLVGLSEVPNLGQASLPEYLSEDAQQHLSADLTASASESPEFFEAALVRGNVVVCLDGLNDVSDRQARALAVRQIEAWVSEFPNCHYVVVARPDTYEPALSRDEFVHYELRPWSERAVKEIELEQDQALDDWAAEEADEDSPADELHPREPVLRRRLLLAASGLRGATVEVGQDVRRQIVDRLIAWMTDVEAVGREDAVRALLRLDGEPYAAERVLEVAKDETRDVWSREAALLLLGRLGGMRIAEALDLLAACVDDAQIESRIQLAAATSLGALGSSALADTEREQIVARLLDRIRKPGAGIDVRVAAGEALSMIQSVAPSALILQTFVALARAENDKERPPYSVQKAAARALGQVLADGAEPEFVEQMLALAGDAGVSDAVRTVLAESLGIHGEAEAAAHVLLGIALDDKVYSPGHRAALEALGRVGYADQTILDQVVQVAQRRDRKVTNFVRLAAARALGGLGHMDLSILHMLRLIADKSFSGSTRNDTLEYLAQCGFTGKADIDAAVVAVLQIWLNEENTKEDVREDALESLRILRAGQDEVIRDVLAVIQNGDTFSRIRYTAAAQLGRFPVEQKEMVVNALSPVFYDPDEKSDLLRVPIARLLFLWGEDEQALAYLRLAAERSCMAEVRYDASMVLLEIGEVDLGAVELLRLAQNPDVPDLIRCDALRALGLWQVGADELHPTEDVASALVEIARDSELEPNVRDAAYAGLRAITA